MIHMVAWCQRVKNIYDNLERMVKRGPLFPRREIYTTGWTRLKGVLKYGRRLDRRTTRGGLDLIKFYRIRLFRYWSVFRRGLAHFEG